MTLHHDVTVDKKKRRKKKHPCSQHQFLLKVGAATVSESDCVFDELVLPGRRCPGLLAQTQSREKKEEELQGLKRYEARERERRRKKLYNYVPIIENVLYNGRGLTSRFLFTFPTGIKRPGNRTRTQQSFVAFDLFLTLDQSFVLYK